MRADLVQRVRERVIAQLRLLARSPTLAGARWNTLYEAVTNAGEALGEAFWAGPTGLDIDRLAGDLGVAVRGAAGSASHGTSSDPAAERRSRTHTQASLHRGPDGLVALLGPDQSEARRRTSIAHELGHSLFWDHSTTPPQRVISYEYMRNREEGACWRFARAVLLPRAILTAYGLLRPGDLRLVRLKAAARQFGVSPALMAARLLEDCEAYPACSYREHTCSHGRPLRPLIYNGRDLPSASRGTQFRAVTRRINPCDPANSQTIIADLKPFGLRVEHSRQEWSTGQRDTYLLEWST